MILLFISVTTLVATGAFVGRLAAVPGEGRAARIVRGALLAFAILIGIEIGLGLGHQLTPGATLGALAAVAFAARLVARDRPPPALAPGPPWTLADAALASALVAAFALRLWTGLHKTTFLYDTLSYHLHEPLSWMHAHRLEIVPSPFGDPAPGYAPANIELWFLFVMAPLRSDLLAGVGQLPFAGLAALAIVAAVRETGGPRAAALAAALAFLLVPEIWQQAPTAMADLGTAALLIATLPFAFRLRRAVSRADLLAWAVALGLGAGSKYVGALLAIPFAVAGASAARRGGARGRDFALPGVVAALAAGYWPARNLIATGNPFYPVAAFGFSGLYDGRLMRAWDYHVPVGDVASLGSMLFASGVGFSLATAVALARGWRRTELPLTCALVALFWLAIPYQESRFLFPAFGVAAVALGRLAAEPPATFGYAALAAAIGGSLFEWPTAERLLIVPGATVGALLFVAGERASFAVTRSGRRLAAVAIAALFLIGLGRCHEQERRYAIGDDIDDAWSWFRANVHGARVAYTGTNLAFPLAGRELANVVRYVNVAGPADARLHDFHPTQPASNAEPAPFRDGASFATWLENLRATRTEVLFVAALYPIVRRNIGADADGFPIERVWADEHPALFRLRYASSAARVYEVRP